MRKKRLFSLALVAALSVTMLAGCGGKKETDNRKTITLGMWPTEDLASDIPMFEGYQKTYEEKYKDVKVEPAPYVYATDTFVSLAESGNCPTIFQSWFTEPPKLIKQGLVADITDEMKERGWLDKMSDEVKDILVSEDGKCYGIPRDAYALGVMCNVELFEKAGLVDKDGIPKFPKTFEELAQTAKTIKDKTGAAGFVLTAKDNNGGWHFSNIAWNFGATLVKDNGDGTYTSNLNSKEAVEAMQWVYDMKWKYDVLTADPTAEDWTTGFQQLGTGGAAMYLAGNDAVAQPTQVNGLDPKKLALGAMPAGPRGDQYSLTGGTPYMFSKDATKEEISAAMDFLKVMGKTPDVTDDATVKGIEADAANRNANGVPVIRDVACWEDEEYAKAKQEAIDEYSNVDARMFDDFFNTIEKEGNKRTEEPGDTQEMYAQITNVLQSVVTNKDCNIQQLMDKANENYQKILDSKFKKDK